MGRVTNDGFTGCVVAPPAWIARARAAFEDLPDAVRAHPALPRWLASDVRHYWSVVRHDAADGEKLRKRDVDAVLSAITRLESALERLPYNSLGSVEGDRLSGEVRAASNGALDPLSAGLGSRRQDFLVNLAAMKEAVRARLGQRRRSGPRPDIWRHELEELVAHDLADAGIRLTKGTSGTLAATLVAIYRAAGIAAPEADSLFATLKRLADRHRALEALAERVARFK